MGDGVGRRVGELVGDIDENDVDSDIICGDNDPINGNDELQANLNSENAKEQELMAGMSLATIMMIAGLLLLFIFIIVMVIIVIKVMKVHKMRKCRVCNEHKKKVDKKD